MYYHASLANNNNCLDSYRLILIAEKDKVYEKFPIPLINRLEKHLVTTSTILKQRQVDLCERLKNWIRQFTRMYVMFSCDVFVCLCLHVCVCVCVCVK